MVLGDEAVGAMAKTFIGEREATEFGEYDHAQVRTGEADLLRSLQPVNPRHAEIEEHQIGLVDGRELNRVQAVTGGGDDLKASGELEEIADGAEGGGGIVGDENANFSWSGHPFCTPALLKPIKNGG